MKKYLLTLCIVGLSSVVSYSANAQVFVYGVTSCGTAPTTIVNGKPAYLTVDTTGKLCDGSGGGGSSVVTGSISNGADAVAVTTTNLGTNAYNYGWNGTGWDRLQVDASKNLKITLQTSIPAGANVIGGVTQSGTWTVQPGNTPNSVPWLVTATGPAASGATKSGNPLQVGAVFNTTQPTVTNGQIVEAQATARGARIVATGIDGFSVNGNISNAASGVATSSTNVPTNSYSYGFNGTTWDQLQVDASKNLKTTAIVTSQTRSARNFPGCTVGQSSATCLAASTAVSFLQIENTSSSATIACGFGVTAVLNSSTSIQLSPNQAASWGPNTGGVPTGAMNCIASVASSPLYVEWN